MDQTAYGFLIFFAGASWLHIASYCDTIAAIPHIARYSLMEGSAPPKWCDTPPLVLNFTQAHFAIPHFSTYCPIIM